MFGVAVGLVGLLSQCEWRFVTDTSRHVGVVQPNGTTVAVGKLDTSGEFIYEHYIDYSKRDFTYILPYFELNGIAIQDQKVYEFRSGMLVPGVMDRDGRFVPTVGGVVTRFTGRGSPGDPPIWNLPGYFLLVPATNRSRGSSR